ncbi:MAG: protein kinase [Myxococcales bacterium]|nr:protein kinase [Myxococcales bacterium]
MTPSRATSASRPHDYAQESDVRHSELFALPRSGSVCNFPPAPFREAAPTLVEEPWFEEIIDAPTSSAAGLSRVAVGTHLGRYELLAPLATFGAASSFIARQRGEMGLSRIVSLLAFPSSISETSGCAELLSEDVRRAAALRHPNVCEVLELCDEGSHLLVATDWVQGVSLQELVVRGERVEPLPVEVAAFVVASAAAGLHAAHEFVDTDGRSMPIVHKNLSLRSIHVSGVGHVRVTGLGMVRALSRLEEQQAESTRAYPKSAGIGYLAPEAISGGGVDRRTDVFSLGAMLYELTTGVSPFTCGNDFQAVEALLSGSYARPSEVVPGFAPELEAIIARALDREPLKRFPTTEAMRAALELWLIHSGLKTSPAQLAEIVNSRCGEFMASRRAALTVQSDEVYASGVRRLVPLAEAPASPAVVRRAEALLLDTPTLSRTVLLGGPRRMSFGRSIVVLAVAALAGSLTALLLYTFRSPPPPVKAATADAVAMRAEPVLPAPVVARPVVVVAEAASVPAAAVKVETPAAAPLRPAPKAAAATAAPVAPIAAAVAPTMPALPDSPY